MKLFISWSGTQSRRIAKAIYTWIPSVIQSVKPYYSSDDIAKGKRWSSELANELNDSEFGLIILTRENLQAPWILFEAGALSKNLDQSRVCPILFNVKETDVKGPLSEFQFTKFDKTDFYKLISDINDYLEESALDAKVLEKVFEKMWPDFQEELEDILKENPLSNEQIREDRELLEEVLSIVRRSHYRNLFRENDLLDRISGSQIVTFDDKTKTISFWDEGDEVYWLGLDQLNTTGHILDFIFQVHGKGWSKPVHIYEFINCIEELSRHYFNENAQGVICSVGSHNEIDWENAEFKRI